MMRREGVMLMLMLMLLSLLIGASYMCYYLVLIMTQKDSALATGKRQTTHLLIL